MSRLLLKRGREVVAAAEVRLFRVPLTQRGIAYMRWGPLWRPRAGAADLQVLRQAVRALRNEYVGRRGMILRIVPRLSVEVGAEYRQVFADEGLSPVEHGRPSKSLLIDLSPELSDVRLGLDQKWRNCLSKAERAGLTVTSGTGLEMFDEFVALYGEMLERKRFTPSANIRDHRRLQALMPERLRMRIALAKHDGRPCAGAVYSAIGDTAVYLFGATNETGMRTSGSYLVQWRILSLLKADGVRYYDLNGIDSRSNPGVYHFKKGLAGRRGIPVTFVGAFQASSASTANQVLLSAEKLRRQIRMARTWTWPIGAR